MTDHPITPPPPHLLKKFSAQARDERSKRNGTGYLKTFATLCIEWAMKCQATSNDRQIRSSEIQPPPELVQQWRKSGPADAAVNNAYERHIATQASRWGADQELEACCEWLRNDGLFETRIGHLRTARRPKPPSLKEQALTALSEADQGLNESEWQQRSDTIRCALEALPE